MIQSFYIKKQIMKQLVHFVMLAVMPVVAASQNLSDLVD